MYTIGQFAAFGRVSVRMLRHYDAIALLTPAVVDERTGYRYYDERQLRDLLRIVELRDLGCSLDDAGTVLESRRTDAAHERDALRTVLERRRAALTRSLDVGHGRSFQIVQTFVDSGEPGAVLVE